MAQLIFISHPEVIVNPNAPIPDWGLTPRGRSRTKQFAQSVLMRSVTAIWSSTEHKAMETAGLLVEPLGLNVQTAADLGENDRSATGFLPPDEFEAAADAFFATPHQSFQGWERAIDAQERITHIVEQIVIEHNSVGDLAIVSHGGVGTLLWCYLNGVEIDRQFDQTGQGNYWVADMPALACHHRWRAI